MALNSELNHRQFYLCIYTSQVHIELVWLRPCLELILTVVNDSTQTRADTYCFFRELRLKIAKNYNKVKYLSMELLKYRRQAKLSSFINFLEWNGVVLCRYILICKTVGQNARCVGVV